MEPINPDWPRFQPGTIVVCQDNELALGGIQQHQTYTVAKQTFAGYLWINGSNHPYIPTRFAQE